MHQIIIEFDKIAEFVNKVGAENILVILPYEIGKYTDYMHFSHPVAESEFNVIFSYLVIYRIDWE